MPAWTWKERRLYRGGYASGMPSFVWNDAHVWTGGYASGLPFLTWDNLDEIPTPMLVFLALLASGEV